MKNVFWSISSILIACVAVTQAQPQQAPKQAQAAPQVDQQAQPQVYGRGRGGIPFAWNDRNKDGICDLTGRPVGQGRAVAGGGRGWGDRDGDGICDYTGRQVGIGRGAAAWGGGGGRGRGRGFASWGGWPWRMVGSSCETGSTDRTGRAGTTAKIEYPDKLNATDPRFGRRPWLKNSSRLRPSDRRSRGRAGRTRTRGPRTAQGGSQMFLIGRKAPDFTAPAYHKNEFVNIKLSEYLGKWILLCFYPGDFTFV